MEIIFHSHANKTHFHKKGFAPSLILKVRVFGTRKWPIILLNLEHSLNSAVIFAIFQSSGNIQLLVAKLMLNIHEGVVTGAASSKSLHDIP